MGNQYSKWYILKVLNRNGVHVFYSMAKYYLTLFLSRGGSKPSPYESHQACDISTNKVWLTWHYVTSKTGLLNSAQSYLLAHLLFESLCKKPNYPEAAKLGGSPQKKTIYWYYGRESQPSKYPRPGSWHVNAKAFRLFQPLALWDIPRSLGLPS